MGRRISKSLNLGSARREASQKVTPVFGIYIKIYPHFRINAQSMSRFMKS
jgi:hypothetical protein